MRQAHMLEVALLHAAQLGPSEDVQAILAQIQAGAASPRGLAGSLAHALSGRNAPPGQGAKAANDRRQTSLMLAASRGCAQSVALLLPWSDELAVDLDGDSALAKACAAGHDHCAALLLTPAMRAELARPPGRGSGPTPMLRACMAGSLACVELLARAGASAAGRVDGLGAIAWAVFNDEPTMIPPLVAAGANMDQRDDYQVTALMDASMRGKEGCAQALLAAGAHPHFSAQGKTALDWALEYGHVGVAAILAAHGARPFAGAGEPPFLTAAKDRAAAARDALCSVPAAAAKPRRT